MNTESRDPLSRWWWPGQWLHIVYGVWVDQLWYWKNVRPQLHGRRQGWGFVIQGMLGAVLVVLIFLVVLQVVVEATGGRTQRDTVLIVVATLGLMFIMSSFAAVIAGVASGMVSSVTVTIAVGLITSMLTSIAPDIFVFALRGKPAPSPALDLGGGMLIVLSMMIAGMAGGVNSGVLEGRNPRLSDVLLLAIIASIVGGVWNIAITVIAISASGLGLYLGNLWAIRQIADIDVRRRLANPETHLSSPNREI
ncbi:MAG TPA: hypothetical protein VJG32_11505 [Anaerolineae bacterium]|nr:hypothetical protein [Anaerolineae bacterium]